VSNFFDWIVVILVVVFVVMFGFVGYVGFDGVWLVVVMGEVLFVLVFVICWG